MSHVTYLWDDARAASLSPADRLVYRSNILGADQRITNTGGGNTSAKLTEVDPLTGQPVRVLWVKGSGGDLRTSTRANFASLYQDRLMQLQDVYAGDERARREVAGRGPHGGPLPALHVQPQPAGDVHRHAAARLRPGSARRSHAPQRGDQRRGVAPLRAADARDLRRRRSSGRHGSVPASNSAWRCRTWSQRIPTRTASCSGSTG